MLAARALGIALALSTAAAAPVVADTASPGLLGWATFPSYPSAANDLPTPPKAGALAAAPRPTMQKAIRVYHRANPSSPKPGLTKQR
jgi:hypothetical protein